MSLKQYRLPSLRDKHDLTNEEIKEVTEGLKKPEMPTKLHAKVVTKTKKNEK